MNSLSVAVVGAGLAGIACALRLGEAGVHARVFEARRAPGGRLATRRFAVASFDHGAQYLTATDGRFRAQLDRAAAAGAADRWLPAWPNRDRRDDLWVGLPAMNSLPRFLAEDLEVEYGARIVRLERSRRGWTLLDDRGAAHAGFHGGRARPAGAGSRRARRRAHAARRAREGRADGALLGRARRLRSATDGVWPTRDSRATRCSAGMPATVPSRDAMRATPGCCTHRPTGRASSSTSPRRTSSARSSTGSRNTSAGRCRARSCRTHTAGVTPEWNRRSARHCLLDPESGIGFCGDWCLDARAEAAWLSGSALGTALSEAREAIGSGKIRDSR